MTVSSVDFEPVRCIWMPHGARVLDAQFVVAKGHQAFNEQGGLHEPAKQQELQRFIQAAVSLARSTRTLARAAA